VEVDDIIRYHDVVTAQNCRSATASPSPPEPAHCENNYTQQRERRNRHRQKVVHWMSY
jgi:hypothetical protein